MQWDKKFKWKWMCCIHFLRQKLFLQLFHLKWNYLLIFFSFTLSEKEKHCSWMHLIVKVLNLEIYLCGIYLRYWKTQFPQNYYYFPSMVYIGYYRNMIIEVTAIEVFQCMCLLYKERSNVLWLVCIRFTFSISENL